MAPVRGSRTFKVKGLLKQLGGRWDQQGRTWWVPLKRLNEALELTKHSNDPVGEDDPNQPVVESWFCWECGDPLPPSDVMMIRAQLMRAEIGESTDLYWCGCNDND